MVPRTYDRTNPLKERQRIVVTGLVILLLLLWLGFTFHASPRFPGSFWGGVLGVSGALLMVWPLAYSAVKRIPFLKNGVTRWLTVRTLLTWHVYTGILGAILAILHTSHKFIHPLGILLTASMLIAVLTGFIGRHFKAQVSEELREKERMLASLQIAYHETAAELARQPDASSVVNLRPSFFARGWLRFFVSEAIDGQSALALSARSVRLAESIADLEYAIKSHELLKRRFAIWLKLHIAASVVFYILLVLHIWAGIYFGLRWFD